MTQVIEETQSTALPPTPPPHDIPAHKTRGKKFGNLPLAEQLLIGRRAFDNTSGNPQIGDVMVRYGYDQNKMAIFNELLTEAIAADNQQIKEYGEKAEAYEDFNKIFSVAKHEYSTLRKLLKVALKTDQKKLNQMLIDDAKKQTVSGLLRQMRACYGNIFSDREVLDRLSVIGINEDILRAYSSNYEAAESAYSVYYKEDSEAINATRIRDDKVEALCDFLSDFFVLARIAFANQPELLKQIT